MVANRPTDPAMLLLTYLASAASEPSGLKTFARYTWQAKQAVRQWLTSLSERPGPTFVICEQVEDVTLVFDDKIRFLQLKTRDAGSWSVAKMADTGLDALVRAYVAAVEVDIVEVSTFELWVEGAIADAAETADFAADPRSAGATIRKKLVDHRAKLDPPPRGTGWIDDFLQRLEIHPDQPPQNCIDAKCLLEIGTIWPHLTASESLLIYERLLDATAAAQAAQTSPRELRRQLAARMRQGKLDFDNRPWLSSPELASLRPQILDRVMLAEYTPPLPGALPERLLARIADGQAMSALEMKQRAAGASDQTVERTQSLRAEMEVARQLLLAGRANPEQDLERLANRVLMVAEATAAAIDLSAATNPAAAARPAEAVAVTLMSEPHRLAAVDSEHLFGGDGLMVYGYLANLSDQCRFGWRKA